MSRNEHMDTFLNVTDYRSRLLAIYSDWISMCVNRKPYRNAFVLFKDYPNIMRQLSASSDFFRIRKIVYPELRKLTLRQHKARARYMNETRFNLFSDAVYESTNREVLALTESVIKYL